MFYIEGAGFYFLFTKLLRAGIIEGEFIGPKINIK